MKRLNIILIRYLFIFLLFAGLLLVFLVPVYNYITDFTLTSELSHIGGRMDQGIESLNSVFSALDLFVLTHPMDSRFSAFKSWAFNPPGQIQKDNVNVITLQELRDSINLAFFSYSINMDAGLLFPDGAAITRRGIYYHSSSAPFYGFFLQCGDLTLDEWRSLLVSNRSFTPTMPYTSVYYDVGEMITYSARWAYMGIPDEIVFFATLPVNGIVDLLADADVAEAAYVRMYNTQGKLLFSRGNENAGSYHVISRRGSTNSIRYEIGVPDSFLTAKLRPVKNLIILFTCITAASLIVISFLFAWRASMPLINSIRTIETQTALIRTQTIDRVKGALLSGNDAAARIILSECYAALPKPEDPLIAGLFAGMLSAMLRDLGNELSNIVPAFEPPEYASGSQEEIFEKRYPDCFTLICEALRTHKEKNIPSHGREVLDYINENLYDPGLYITMATNHFNISAPTLQKLVKQCTGQTFLDYVEKRRMDKACELLYGSDESVTRIAELCGFPSAATFSYVFKRIYGFPPSKLRENRGTLSR